LRKNNAKAIIKEKAAEENLLPLFLWKDKTQNQVSW
jgi:hypothetical protein